MGIEFFLITILVKDFNLDVSLCFECANNYGPKIFAK